MIPYINLAVYVILSSATGLIASSLHVSSWLLHGLYSYIYPDNSEEQARNDLRKTRGKEDHDSLKNLNVRGRSSMTEGEKSFIILKGRDRKKKEKNKEKFNWEEANSQIYRLSLTYSHLAVRLYFSEYDEVVVYSMIGVVNILAYECLSYLSLSGSESLNEQTVRYDVVPFLMALFAVCKILWSLSRVGWQRYTSKTSELIVSIIVGFVGFMISLHVLFFTPERVLEFGFEEVIQALNPNNSNPKQRFIFGFISPMLAKLVIALVAGTVSGILTIPAHRSVKAFWLGTDQLEWNIPMLDLGIFAQLLLYLTTILPLFAAILWIKPMAELFIASNSSQGLEQSSGNKLLGAQFWGRLVLPSPSADWAQDFGVAPDVFASAQFWILMISGLLQLCLFRVNVQVYLNEGIMAWYENLHGSKVMNLELTRAKLLLNSYFLCRSAIQFFVPGTLVILLLGMSRVWGRVPISKLVETSITLLFIRRTTLFMAWWVTFSWGILTCVTLTLYRTGFVLFS
jgi:hypothetical protein